jgi:hypothetical protein
MIKLIFYENSVNDSMNMNHPFNIALAEEKEEEVRVLLTQKYPRLPIEIIQTAIDTCTWYTLFQGTNRYNTQMALDTFAEMASNVVEERQEQSNDVIEMIFLEHEKSASSTTERSDLVNGILSIPHGILRLTLKSAHNMWNSV